MERELNGPYWALRLAYGLVPIVAGLDKFFNLLTNWEQYVSPLAANVIAPGTLMQIVGVVEIIAGILVLTSKTTRVGAWIVCIWLIAIVLNLITTGRYFDIAVRDAVMAVGAFTLAKLEEARLRHGVPETARRRAVHREATA
ncbi:MAG: DoxX family protein [Myxococcaceae bacterium]|nr:DoxX family protein [Myxococcaceae bacterium]